MPYGAARIARLLQREAKDRREAAMAASREHLEPVLPSVLRSDVILCGHVKRDLLRCTTRAVSDEFRHKAISLRWHAHRNAASLVVNRFAYHVHQAHNPCSY